jgi:hypothetical protein
VHVHLSFEIRLVELGRRRAPQENALCPPE